MRVVWESTDRVLTEDGMYDAVFSEKVAYEVPIGERAPPDVLNLPAWLRRAAFYVPDLWNVSPVTA